jgi:hypothetical protein
MMTIRLCTAGLYAVGMVCSCKKVSSLNSIRASAKYPAYDPRFAGQAS